MVFVCSAPALLLAHVYVLVIEPDASSKSKKIKTSNLLSVWAEEETEEADNCESELTSDLNSNNPNAIVLDELEHYSYIHTTHKIRGFAFRYVYVVYLNTHVWWWYHGHVCKCVYYAV